MKRIGSLLTPPNPANLEAMARQSKALADGALKLKALNSMRAQMGADVFEILRAEAIAQTKAEYSDDAEWIDSSAECALFEQANLPN